VTRYLPVEMSSVVRASISPDTAKALLGAVSLGQVENKVRYAPPHVLALVRRELAELATVAQIQFDEGTPAIAPVSPLATTGKPLDEWITTSEAAQVLGKSAMTVRRYIEAGTLTSKRKDKKSFLVLRESVEALRFGKQAA